MIPFLAENEFSRQGLISTLLKKTHAEPGLVIVPRLVVRNLSHRSYGIQPEQLAPQVRNALEGVGLLPAATPQKFDQVGDILKTRFKIAYWGKWRNVLGSEYSHCLSMLLSANTKYDSDRSEWLAWQDSFNDALFKAIQVHLNRLTLKGACLLKDSKGVLIDYGSLLDPNKPFATAYPVIGFALRKAHVRRNALPTSHPYEKKTAKRTTYLKKKEQRELAQELGAAYLEIETLLDSHL